MEVKATVCVSAHPSVCSSEGCLPLFALRMLSCAGQEMLGCKAMYGYIQGIMGNDYRPPACLSGLLSDQKLVYNEQWPNVCASINSSL